MKLKSNIMTIAETQFSAGAGGERGKSLGLAEGSRQKALETARLMKQANCKIPFIEKMTELSQTGVAAL